MVKYVSVAPDVEFVPLSIDCGYPGLSAGGAEGRQGRPSKEEFLIGKLSACWILKECSAKWEKECEQEGSTNLICILEFLG